VTGGALAAAAETLIERLSSGRKVTGAGGIFDPSARSSRPGGDEARDAAEAVVAAIGFELSDGPVKSPQGLSAGMFSRRPICGSIPRPPTATTRRC
jgi:hypothetical protein